jgi:hypothetical protein
MPKEVEMQRAFFPIIYSASPAATRAIGSAGLSQAAILALRAMLKHGRSLEVAHQQVSFQGQDLSFCSRITARGDLVIELDLGDARLAHRIILEDELKRAERRTPPIRGQR